MLSIFDSLEVKNFYVLGARVSEEQGVVSKAS
jgi:hypothetical protein